MRAILTRQFKLRSHRPQAGLTGAHSSIWALDGVKSCVVFVIAICLNQCRCCARSVGCSTAYNRVQCSTMGCIHRLAARGQWEGASKKSEGKERRRRTRRRRREEMGCEINRTQPKIVYEEILPQLEKGDGRQQAKRDDTQTDESTAHSTESACCFSLVRSPRCLVFLCSYMCSTTTDPMNSSDEMSTVVGPLKQTQTTNNR